LDTEVLTLLLQAGASDADCTAQIGAPPFGRTLLADLAPTTTLEDLAVILGVERTRAAALAAALELCRRLLIEPLATPLRVCSPNDIGPQLVIEMGGREQECLRVVLLDTKNQILAMHTIYQGNVNQISIRVGEVFREAVRQNATALIVAHNHPSGDPTPSPEDVAVTRTLVDAGKLVDVEVLDHLVVGSRAYVSLKERGLGFTSAR
jgi:DNA repair protein RadC